VKRFKRHKISSAFLTFYLLWWTLIANYSFSEAAPTVPTCDFRPMAFILLTPVMGCIYSIAFLAKHFTSKSPAKTDYLVFIFIVTCPLIIGGLYLFNHA